MIYTNTVNISLDGHEPFNVLADPVTDITGLSVDKTADKEFWAGGYLTYTITLDNTGADSSNLTNVLITDTLQDEMTYVVDSATITEDGTPVTDITQVFRITGQTLEFGAPTALEVDANTTTVITFQVSKA